MRTLQSSLFIASVCFACGSRFEASDGVAGVAGAASASGSSSADAGAPDAGASLGASAGTGADSSGGASSAGASSGGASHGGAAHGGASHGGASQGGALNGGSSNGGSSNGGSSNGGATNGGSSNGGATNGGATNGGMGGTAGADCTSLRNTYLADLQRARACDPVVPGQCSASSTLPGACNCPVLVNSKSKYTEQAKLDAKAIESAGCQYAGCGVACVAFPAVACSLDTAAASTSYVCTGSAN